MPNPKLEPIEKMKPTMVRDNISQMKASDAKINQIIDQLEAVKKAVFGEGEEKSQRHEKKCCMFNLENQFCICPCHVDIYSKGGKPTHSDTEDIILKDRLEAAEKTSYPIIPNHIEYYPTPKPKALDEVEKVLRTTKLYKEGGSCFECCGYEGMVDDLRQTLTSYRQSVIRKCLEALPAEGEVALSNDRDTHHLNLGKKNGWNNYRSLAQANLENLLGKQCDKSSPLQAEAQGKKEGIVEALRTINCQREKSVSMCGCLDEAVNTIEELLKQY